MPDNGRESRNVVVNGHRTSMRLEKQFWRAIDEMCTRENMTLNQFCNEVARRRGRASLTASARVFVVGYFREILERDQPR